MNSFLRSGLRSWPCEPVANDPRRALPTTPVPWAPHGGSTRRLSVDVFGLWLMTGSRESPITLLEFTSDMFKNVGLVPQCLLQMHSPPPPS
ncbi:hypothetical protein A0H81_02332 [Grifola frondosa]|uniref:Uncharacterized protein n=1 Tax=Grifola frondosa TaxID=5627 RepID=A0A1C7MKI2_GRIFR|nr:hypothetical protein A0H81_02332 [Grifola frondosa]